MKKLFFLSIIAIFISTSCFSAKKHCQGCFPDKKNYQARAAAASSSDAMSLSMVTWGVLLTGGIIALCLLLKSSSGSSSHSHTSH